MRLMDLNTLSGVNVLLVYTVSQEYRAYVYEKMMQKCGSIADTVLTINSKQSTKDVLKLTRVKCMYSKKWLAVLDDCDDGGVFLKSLLRVRNSCVTCLCFVSKYRVYKKLVALLSEEVGFYGLVGCWLGKQDFYFIYRDIVGQKGTMTPNMLKFMQENYSHDTDVIFNIFRDISHGEVLKSRSDILKIYGVGSRGADLFLFKMLKGIGATTDKGFRTRARLRLKEGEDLSVYFGWGGLWNRFHRSLNCLIQLKEGVISGKWYDRVDDNEVLSKYECYLSRLRGVSMSSLLTLGIALDAREWRDGSDYAVFLYTYLNGGAEDERIESA